MKVNVNNLEQYGRRNSLRFNNLTVDTSQKEDDMIHAVVMFINNNMMQNRTEQNIYFIDVNCTVSCQIHEYNNKFTNGHNRCIHILTTKS